MEILVEEEVVVPVWSILQQALVAIHGVLARGIARNRLIRRSAKPLAISSEVGWLERLSDEPRR
jgi:hypothetical protein